MFTLLLLALIAAGILATFEDAGGAESPPADEGTTEARTEAGIAAQPEPDGVNAGGQRPSESVPYDRFQAVNQELSTLNQRAHAAGYGSAAEYLEAVEAWNQQQYAASEEADPIDARLRAVEELEAERMFRDQFQHLSQQFPLADLEDVKRALLIGEHRSMSSAMESVHRREQAKRDKWLAEHSQTAARRSEAGAEGGGGGATSAGVNYRDMPLAEFRKVQEAVLSRQR